MRVIMLMFDSLNRHMLEPYGCDWTHTPNFKRLAERSVTFDKSYVGSMPCMPARRELHTARPNFLHRSWGPLEPFDDSVPEMLKNAGVYTHLCSDHYHYWEDGGATYHNRYSTWEFYRGQEDDNWIGQVDAPQIPENINPKGGTQSWVSRSFMRDVGDHSQERTIKGGLQFIERNKDADNWFLQIECFDPHEPFVSRRLYKDLYPDDYDGPIFDWPDKEVVESPEAVEHLRNNYAALLSMCDAHLGDVLDAMDANEMWEDTMFIVWTDHGFTLSEHGWWGKNVPPLYEEVSHTPFFIWDPRSGKAGERRQSLVQPALDLGPTLLDFFGQQLSPDMLGKPLSRTIKDDTPVRAAALFGYHGKAINVTDGRYVYLRQPISEDAPLFDYTLMTTEMRGFKKQEDLEQMTLADPFTFTKNCQLLKIPRSTSPLNDFGHLLFDLESDPAQDKPLEDAAIEEIMIAHIKRLMNECEAPLEQYERFGFVK